MISFGEKKKLREGVPGAPSEAESRLSSWDLQPAWEVSSPILAHSWQAAAPDSQLYFPQQLLLRRQLLGANLGVTSQTLADVALNGTLGFAVNLSHCQKQHSVPGAGLSVGGLGDLPCLPGLLSCQQDSAPSGSQLKMQLPAFDLSLYLKPWLSSRPVIRASCASQCWG